MIEQTVYPSVERVMEVTRFKDKELALSAIRTLKWLEQGAPHAEDDAKHIRFEMTAFRMPRHKFDEQNHIYRCGTSCCIAGAILEFSESEILKSQNTIKTAFGVVSDDKDDPLAKLFYPWEHGHQLSPYNDPYVAAETLRRYLFTGVVQWT